MAKYEVQDNRIGAYAKKLAAATEDEVVFADTLKEVEVTSDGAERIYFTVDGSAPTVAGSNTYEIPAMAAARTVRVPSRSLPTVTVVKLVSAGTPTYSVARSS